MREKIEQYLIIRKFDDRLGTWENELVRGEDNNRRGRGGGNEKRSGSCQIHLLLILQEVEFAKSGSALKNEAAFLLGDCWCSKF